MGDHDAFFKLVFEDPARAAGEARAVLPTAIANAVDLDALDHVPGSFVDAALVDRHTDLLFRTRLRASDGERGEEAYVYLLLEHQSKPDPLMTFRVLTYMVRIWERHLRETNDKTLAPILPIVVHHGEQGWRAPRHFHQMFPALAHVPSLRRYVPRFVVAVDDLVTRSDELLLSRPLDVFGRLTLWALRDARNARRFDRHLAAWLGLLVQLARQRADDDIFVFLRYLSRVLAPGHVDAVGRQVVAIAPDTESTMITHAEFHELRGHEKGLEEGRITAKRDVLRGLMTAKLGPLSEAAITRIDAATEAETDAFLQRILTATSEDQVLG